MSRTESERDSLILSIWCLALAAGFVFVAVAQNDWHDLVGAAFPLLLAAFIRFYPNHR